MQSLFVESRALFRIYIIEVFNTCGCGAGRQFRRKLL